MEIQVMYGEISGRVMKLTIPNLVLLYRLQVRLRQQIEMHLSTQLL